MKTKLVVALIASVSMISFSTMAKPPASKISKSVKKEKNLYIDVHHLNGPVNFEEVKKAHLKDLAIEKKNGVHFLKFWVNEEKGLVFCLSSSSDTESIIKTHSEAHGLIPEEFYKVSSGAASTLQKQDNFFLDVHLLGKEVPAKEVAAAHEKDLAVEEKHGVNFINYWVDEKRGMVMCLSQANDTSSIIATHKEAHGLLPDYIVKVKQGK